MSEETIPMDYPGVDDAFREEMEKRNAEASLDKQRRAAKAERLGWSFQTDLDDMWDRVYEDWWDSAKIAGFNPHDPDDREIIIEAARSTEGYHGWADYVNSSIEMEEED